MAHFSTFGNYILPLAGQIPEIIPFIDHRSLGEGWFIDHRSLGEGGSEEGHPLSLVVYFYSRPHDLCLTTYD